MIAIVILGAVLQLVVANARSSRQNSMVTKSYTRDKMLHTYLTTVRNVKSETALYMGWTNLHVLTTWSMVGSTAHGTRTTNSNFNINEYIEQIAALFEVPVDQVELHIIKRE